MALSLLVYAQVRLFQFVNWDDSDYVSQNAAVKRGLTWATTRWAFDNTASPNFHPLTWLSHALDVSVFGLAPGAFHLVNVGWHVATVVGVYWLLRAMTGRAGRSFIVAAAFAVHPLHVESVAWIAERKDVLSAFLAIATAGAYLKAVVTNSQAWKIAVIVLFALALMAKPMVVTLPALLLILDFWPLGRVGVVPVRRLIVEKLPLLVLAMADAIITINLQAGSGAMPGLGQVAIGQRVARSITAYAIYFWQAFWPLHLAAFYPLRPVGSLAVVAAALVLVVISVAAVQLRRRAPYVLAGWLWFLVSLAPVIGLLQAGEQAHADRYMYLALLGILIAVVWGADELLARWNASSYPRVIAAVVPMVPLVVLANLQTATWSDSVSLWHQAATVTAGNYIAAEKLGSAYSGLGRLDEARQSYAEALALAPPSSPTFLALVHNDLGLLLAQQGRPADATHEFQIAMTLDPSSPNGAVNLGNALASEGQVADAAKAFASALKVDPKAAEAEIGLGNIALSGGHTAEALAHFEKAVALNPELPDAQNGLGSALIESDQPERALAPLTLALEMRPRFPSAAFNVAVALVKLGRTNEARVHLEAALRDRPDFESARNLLAQINR